MKRLDFGDVAQLARAPALQAGGRGFESHRLHHSISVEFDEAVFVDDELHLPPLPRYARTSPSLCESIDI